MSEDIASRVLSSFRGHFSFIETFSRRRRTQTIGQKSYTMETWGKPEQKLSPGKQSLPRSSYNNNHAQTEITHHVWDQQRHSIAFYCSKPFQLTPYGSHRNHNDMHFGLLPTWSHLSPRLDSLQSRNLSLLNFINNTFEWLNIAVVCSFINLFSVKYHVFPIHLNSDVSTAYEHCNFILG